MRNEPCRYSIFGKYVQFALYTTPTSVIFLYPPATTLDDIVKKVRDEKITRTAIVIISDVIDPKTYEYSKLYDKKFSHGYRKAKLK